MNIVSSLHRYLEINHKCIGIHRLVGRHSDSSYSVVVEAVDFGVARSSTVDFRVVDSGIIDSALYESGMNSDVAVSEVRDFAVHFELCTIDSDLRAATLDLTIVRMIEIDSTTDWHILTTLIP